MRALLLSADVHDRTVGGRDGPAIRPHGPARRSHRPTCRRAAVPRTICAPPRPRWPPAAPERRESALEMAQTRMLDRSVPLGQTDNPSDNPTIRQITQARQALAAQDRAACLQAIQAAIASATAQGL